MKKELIIASTIVFCLSILGCAKPPCFDCGMAKKSPCGSSCRSEQSCDFEHCLSKAPCFALMNKKELALTEEQEGKIKQLCTETQKQHIKLEADIDVVCIDIKSKLFENPINTADVNKLLDQKYELKKKEAKNLVQTLVSLKGILTPEQVDKLKELKKNCSKGSCCSKENCGSDCCS